MQADIQPVKGTPGFNKPEYDLEDKSAENKKFASDLVEIQASLGKLPFLAFVIIGTTELVGWNGLLNAQFDIYNTVWDVQPVPNLHTALYSIFSAVATLLAILYSDFFVRPIITQIGISLTFIDAIFFVALTYTRASISTKLINFLGSLMGISACLIGCSAFGYANYFPRSYAGAMSVGFGVAGVLTFVIWMIARMAIFPNTIHGVCSASLILQICAMLFAIISFFFILIFFRNEKVKYILSQRKKEKEEASQRVADGIATDEDYAMLNVGVRGIIHSSVDTFKVVYGLTIAIFFTMFVTLFIFPNIAPLALEVSPLSKNLAIGGYQFGDLIGRYLPNLIPILMVKEWGVYTLTLARCIIAATSLLAWRMPLSAALNYPAGVVIQVLILGITNGWIMTAAMSCMPTRVESALAKARCGTIALLAIVFGIAGGQWAVYAMVNSV